jgi:glutathione synthase
MAIKEFYNQHQDIVLKPLYAYGGSDVFMLKKHDKNFNVIVASLLNSYDSAIVVQKFLPQVLEQEKRIFMINGKAVAGICKKPAAEEIRANLGAGGETFAYVLNKKDHEICEEIGPSLKDRGIIFAGIDMIGNYITEINVTSPSLIPALNKLDNIRLESTIWDSILNIGAFNA